MISVGSLASTSYAMESALGSAAFDARASLTLLRRLGFRVDCAAGTVSDGASDDGCCDDLLSFVDFADRFTRDTSITRCWGGIALVDGPALSPCFAGGR